MKTTRDIEKTLIVLLIIILGSCSTNFPEDRGGDYFLYDLLSNSDSTTEVVSPFPTEPGLSFGGTSTIFTSEQSTPHTVMVSLKTKPESEVLVNLESSDTTEASLSTDGIDFTASVELLFDSGNWDISQPFLVKGLPDGVVDGDIIYSVIFHKLVSSDPVYNGIDPSDIAAINFDTDIQGPTLYEVNVSPTYGLVVTEDGDTMQFGVVLTAPPSGTVLIPIASSDTGEVKVSTNKIVFNALNWFDPITVTLTGVDDPQKDGDIPVTINLGPLSTSDPNYQSVPVPSVSVINLDND